MDSRTQNYDEKVQVVDLENVELQQSKAKSSARNICRWVAVIFFLMTTLLLRLVPRMSFVPAVNDFNAPSGPMSVSIIESNGWHDEVFASIVSMFLTAAPSSDINLYLENPRWEIDSIINDIAAAKDTSVKINPFAEWSSKTETSDFLVLTTCELDLNNIGKFELSDNTHLICVIHNSGKDMSVHDTILRPLIAENRITFMGLSRHTSDYFQRNLIEFSPFYRRAQVTYFYPLFDVAQSEPEPCHFSIQGNIDPSRRDIRSTLNELSTLWQQDPALESICDLKVSILGWGRTLPAIPEYLADKTTISVSLAYPAFYSALGTSMVVLPAFATDTYYVEKASSTVPAALIAGTSLAASQLLIDTYDYVLPQSTWQVKDGMSEVASIVAAIKKLGRAGVERMMTERRDGIARTKQIAYQANAKLIQTLHARTLRTRLDVKQSTI